MCSGIKTIRLKRFQISIQKARVILVKKLHSLLGFKELMKVFTNRNRMHR